MKDLITEFAKYLHYSYEEFSKEEGWETQEKCRVEFEKLPKENQIVMNKMSEHLISKYNLINEDFVKDMLNLKKGDLIEVEEKDNTKIKGEFMEFEGYTDILLKLSKEDNKKRSGFIKLFFGRNSGFQCCNIKNIKLLDNYNVEKHSECYP